jgi:hypothetical protein
MNKNEKKGKVYKLICDDDYYYIGSTNCKYLCQRFSSHKSSSKEERHKNNKLYSHINSIGWNKVKIILIEEFDYTSFDDLKRREHEHISKSLNDVYCLNNNRAVRTEEEKIEQLKAQYSKHKNKIHTIIKCECGVEHTYGRTQQHINSVKHKSYKNVSLTV